MADRTDSIGAEAEQSGASEAANEAGGAHASPVGRAVHRIEAAMRDGSHHASLGEIHRTVGIPAGKRWWWRLFAFAGPAYMVSVGYMDPGNWATDIEGGARFGYALIWVLLMSNLMAVLLQALSARLGIVTGYDLAQACRDEYGHLVRWTLYVLCEIAIAACDLAEVLGTAIGLNLLFGIPLLPAVLITGFDVLLLLGIQKLGVRKMEAFIITLITTIGLCFIVEMFLSKPSLGGIASGFVPTPLDGGALYVAIGILGATVMPHNLYLHSSLVQSRNVQRHEKGLAQACRYNLIDSAVALNAAFLVNAAILILAAAVFWRHDIVVTEIRQAHQLLEGLLGSAVAPAAFAVALICAGQSSTLTGTLAGQITMEGFLHFRMRPWLRRLITRLFAIVPAVVVIAWMGNEGTYQLLIFSQVVLSLQLPFAVVPLVRFTTDKGRMGRFANRWWVATLAWGVAAIIIVLNAALVYQQVVEWVAGAGGAAWIAAANAPMQASAAGVTPGAVTAPGGTAAGWAVLIVCTIVVLALVGLLLWLIFKPSRKAAATVPRCPKCGYEMREGTALPRCPACGETLMTAAGVAERALAGGQGYRRIGVALEAIDSDSQMLAEAIALAKAHRAALVLMHVVEGAGGQWHGSAADDAESRSDEGYLIDLATRLKRDLADAGVPDVQPVLGHGPVVAELVRLAQEQAVDLLVVGGHGHRGLADVVRGQTITGVRHGLSVPIFAVRRK